MTYARLTQRAPRVVVTGPYRERFPATAECAATLAGLLLVALSVAAARPG